MNHPEENEMKIPVWHGFLYLFGGGNFRRIPARMHPGAWIETELNGNDFVPKEDFGDSCFSMDELTPEDAFARWCKAVPQ